MRFRRRPPRCAQLARVQERGRDGARGTGSWTIITTFLGLVFRVFLYLSIAVRLGYSILDSRFSSYSLYFCARGRGSRRRWLMAGRTDQRLILCSVSSVACGWCLIEGQTMTDCWRGIFAVMVRQAAVILHDLCAA